ncbi:MAG: hypothetical protein HKN42_12295, partial [Granulosicoccus sp.]|nr:hypothetical protein [Granulosicoccus sp.]
MHATATQPGDSSSTADLDSFTAIDTGGRNPAGSIGFFIAFVAFTWSAFQLYVSSSVPFWLAEELG